MKILKWYEFVIICIANSFLFYIMDPIDAIDVISCVIIDFVIMDIINEYKDYKNSK